MKPGFIQTCRNSGDPFLLEYADFLEEVELFKSIRDGFCGLKGEKGRNYSVKNYMRLLDLLGDERGLDGRTETVGDIMEWFVEYGKLLAARDAEFRAIIARNLKACREASTKH